jgi:hypothetical protein
LIGRTRLSIQAKAVIGRRSSMGAGGGSDSGVWLIGRAEWSLLFPKLLGRDARAFRHRHHFRPHHLRIDGSLADPRAIAAIASGNNIPRPTSLA